MTTPKPINTRNDFLLTSAGAMIAPMAPIRISTRQQAYRTAAWIQLMGDTLPDDGSEASYDDVLLAIANT